MKVVFGLNYFDYAELVEFDDNVTEEEISEAYNKWLQEQVALGWYYYEEE